MPDKQLPNKFEKISGRKIEKGADYGFEKKEGVKEIVEDKKTANEVYLKEDSSSIVAVANAQHGAREAEKQIEKVLEKDLAEIYLNLSPDKQEEFRARGEETAREINKLLQKTRVKAREVIDLIKKWLSVIPGINKYFLEQEAKIKADEILRLKKIPNF